MACSRGARRLGVKPGMPLAEAEALCAGAEAQFEPHDPPADRAALRQLAIHCQRFTPLAAVDDADEPDALLLDVTGCGYGFGGLEGLARTVVRDASQKCSYFATAALADTVGAAWAIARHGIALSADPAARVRIVPPGEPETALRPLPVEALRLPSDVVALLHEFDIRRIEQLLAVPRAALPSRFGPALLHRLDQALGAAAETINPEPQDEPISACWSFDPPVADGRLLDAAIGQLLERLLARLHPRGLGVQRLICSLNLTTGEPVRMPVGLVRPSTAFAHLMELLRLHRERVRVKAEIAEVALFVAQAAPLEYRQDEMFEAGSAIVPLAPLIERLISRLGESAVLRPELEPDPQPEYAWRLAATRSASGAERDSALGSEDSVWRLNHFRPPRLARRPVAVRVMSVVPGGPPLRFEWRQQAFRVARAWGPERIETGWWRGDDVRRDYYQVETADGERYWLFRRWPDERWFLHGVFS
jgi:protein ImuB